MDSLQRAEPRNLWAPDGGSGRGKLLLMRRLRWFVPLIIIAVLPAAALAARTVLETEGGAEREAAVQALSGKPSGVTVTTPHGNGACTYTGRGDYIVDDSGELSVYAEQLCAGETMRSSRPICSLSSDLQCAPGGRFPHTYRVTRAGLTVDTRLLPWRVNGAPSIPDLLAALQQRIVAGQALAHAQQPTRTVNTSGLAVSCRAPRSTFTVRSQLSNLMTYQQRLDPDGVCADRVLDDFLTHAQEGDAVTSTSPLGRCFQAAGKVTDWTATSCTVIRH